MINLLLLGLGIIFIAWLVTKFLAMMEAPGFLATATWIVAAALVVVKVILPLLGISVGI